MDPARLSSRPLILDGGLATELERRRHDTTGPLWSARVLLDAPEAIEQLHYDYYAAGADCVISASYQASYDGFRALGVEADQTTTYLIRSVELASAARDRFLRASQATSREPERALYVAASIGPYGAMLHDGSEYHGNYGVTLRELRRFHEARFGVLAGCSPDVLACETVPSLEEASVLMDLIRDQPSIDAWISFTSHDGIHTAHGEPLLDRARAVDGMSNVVAVGVNCLHPSLVLQAIQTLRSGTDKPVVAYPNSGEGWNASARRWSGTATSASLADLAPAWVEGGARIVGGCCRTGPSDIAALEAALRPRE